MPYKDPAVARAYHKKYAAEWNARNHDAIEKKRHAKLAAMSDSELAEYKARRAERQREIARANPEQLKKHQRDYYYRNADKRKAAYRAWSKLNPQIIREQAATRRARVKMAIPKWANKAAIRAIYSKAAEMTKRDGVQYHVDHIYPLCGSGFVGLHVESNLQILTATENMVKGNRQWPQ